MGLDGGVRRASVVLNAAAWSLAAVRRYGLLAGGALIDGVCEPWMASQPPGSLPVLLFGTGKGAGAALLLFLLGLLGVAVCLVFGRLLRKYTFREEP